MKRKWAEKYSFWSGALISDERAVLLMGNDALAKEKIPHTNLVLWDAGKRNIQPLDWSAVSVCRNQRPNDEVIAIGLEGEILAGDFAGMKQEPAIDIESDRGKVGHLRSVRSVAGRAYVVGINRQVYRREHVNTWTILDDNIPSGVDTVVGFESIAGFAEDELYAVGWGGEIWNYNGVTWHAVASPTDLVLSSATAAHDSKIYACGQGGTILAGRENEWEIIEHDATRQHFWDVLWFKDKIYMSTQNALFSYNGTSVQLVQFEEDLPFSFYHLSKTDNTLWSIGAKDVMSFDGENWTRIY